MKSRANRRPLSARGGIAAAGVLALGVLTMAGARAEGPASDPLTALEEGNRLFRNGQLDEAAEAYRSGYSPDAVHPTLLYNLGTTLHHLDRLPEAILWYRRAAEAEDPWMEENLWLARRSLGSQVLPAGGTWGWLGRHTGTLRVTAIVAAWASLALLVAAPRVPMWSFGLAAALAALLYAGALAADRWGPRPAVMLQDCFTSAGELPAGTEAWVRPAPGGGWRVVGTDGAICGGDTVELIFPDA